jgi:hypothetical protein
MSFAAASLSVVFVRVRWCRVFLVSNSRDQHRGANLLKRKAPEHPALTLVNVKWWRRRELNPWNSCEFLSDIDLPLRFVRLVVRVAATLVFASRLSRQSSRRRRASTPSCQDVARETRAVHDHTVPTSGASAASEEANSGVARLERPRDGIGRTQSHSSWVARSAPAGTSSPFLPQVRKLNQRAIRRASPGHRFSLPDTQARQRLQRRSRRLARPHETSGSSMSHTGPGR